MSELIEARKKRIGERANALRRAGYYSADEVRDLAQWLKDGMPLIQIEVLLSLAEEDVANWKTINPEPQPRRTA